MILFITQPVESWAANAKQKKTEVGTGVMAGDGLVQYRHTCILFKVFFISDDFFVGLREIETIDGMRFEKHRTRYDKFPDHLIVDVEATVWKCPLKGGSMPPSYGASLIEGASFQVNWQPAGETVMLPAKLISMRMDHSPGMKWDYLLELQAKDIPLTDTLVIDVSLRQDISHASLRGRLGKRRDVH